MQRHKVLINFALALVFLFGAAFSCHPSNSNRRTSRSDRPTEEDVKQLVTIRNKATSIESVEFGSSRRARIADQDNGVPEDATVYAVRVRYTYIDTYFIDHPEKQEYYAFDFYINKFGQWDALLRGPVANQPAG